jgi:hypothetical protein
MIYKKKISIFLMTPYPNKFRLAKTLAVVRVVILYKNEVTW